MAGVLVTIQIDPRRMADAERALARLQGDGLAQIGFEIGGLVEDQTKRRIADDKTAPDGTPWPAWSPRYAETREARHSLLVGRGDLRDSIQNYTDGAEIRVGSNLVYAAAQHFGSGLDSGGIPARAFLGLSTSDEAEITDLVISRIEEMLQ